MATPKYEYEINTHKDSRQIIVYENDVKIYDKTEQLSLSDEDVKTSAITSLEEKYPDVINMSVKTSYTSTKTDILDAVATYVATGKLIYDKIKIGDSITNSIDDIEKSSQVSKTNDNLNKDVISSSSVANKTINIITPPINTSKINTTKKTKDYEAQKYQIYQTEIKPTIELDEVRLDDIETRKIPHRTQDMLSIEIPLIRINDHIFNRDEIADMTIDCTGFLPMITLSVNFLSQGFLTKQMPKDGDIISIVIRNESNVLRMIRNDYVITSVHVNKNLTETKTPVIMTFYGELFIPGLRSQSNDFSFEGTTYEALQDFAKRYGLGFASNESNTSDKQIWLKANMSGEAYVYSIVSKAYKDQTSFYNCWIDVYYNLNFINVNKQLLSIEESVDITALTSSFLKNWNYGVNTAVSEDDALQIPKVFSNYPSHRTTSFFVNSWWPINRSSDITFTLGAKTVCEMFEHNVNVYSNPNAPKYWKIEKEPMYDKNKASYMWLPRGRTPDTSSNSDDNSMKRANYSNYAELYQKMPWLGIQYTVSNSDDSNLQWDGNHHKNYQLARIQNLINNKELDKINVYIQVDGVNLGVIRGDKLPLILFKTNDPENVKLLSEGTMPNLIELLYSGWFYVKGFKITWTSESRQSIISPFTHEFVLTRREWPAPVPVVPIESPEVTKVQENEQ